MTSSIDSKYKNLKRKMELVTSSKRYDLELKLDNIFIGFKEKMLDEIETHLRLSDIECCIATLIENKK